MKKHISWGVNLFNTIVDWQNENYNLCLSYLLTITVHFSLWLYFNNHCPHFPGYSRKPKVWKLLLKKHLWVNGLFKYWQERLLQKRKHFTFQLGYINTHTHTHTNDDLVTNFYLLTLMWVLESILRRVFESDNNNLKRLSATFGYSNSSNLTLIKLCPSHNLFSIYKFQNIQYVNVNL